jgi:putative hemolysin
MKITSLVGFAALLSFAAGCAAETSNPQQGRESASVSSAPADPAAPAAGPSATPSTPSTPTAPAASCTPIAAPSGGVNPASVYCAELGYTLDGEDCAFPDGTRCEEWAFFRGECGGAHSFCNLHGGAISTKTEDMGGWTAVYAICTLPDGKQCKDDDFAHSCACD